MKKLLVSVLLIMFLAPTFACYNIVHVVGSGGIGTRVTEERQWFAIFGLVEMNSINSREISRGVVNYTVETEVTPVDFIISIFTSVATIQCCTVRVTE